MAHRSSDAITAALEGGPLDGREHPVQVGTDELIVVMSDGAQHRYIASVRVQTRPDGRVTIFEYRGRHYTFRSADDG
jgi:hypothetical protein